MRAPIQIALTIVVGGAAGTAGSLLTSRRADPAVPPIARASSQSTETNNAIPAFPAYAALYSGPDNGAAAADAGPSAVVAQPESNFVANEVAVQKEREYFDEARSAHEREATDPSWARESQRSLSEDFQRLAAKGGYEVVNVDCRTTTCATSLRWPSYEAARKASGAIMHGSYELNCTRELYMPPPSDFGAAYEATVLMDCESER